ncbi:MAG: hypothetical protein ACRCX8_18565 [Sarcina sp.]
MEYGEEIFIQKAMDFTVSSNWGKYKANIINISSDLLILLADTRNKLRLLNKDYYMYTTYQKVDIDFFIGNRDNCEDTTTYEFFINSLSKTKVVLTLVEGEQGEVFIKGEELTSDERNLLEKGDKSSLTKGLMWFENGVKNGHITPPKTRWDKSKSKDNEIEE